MTLNGKAKGNTFEDVLVTVNVVSLTVDTTLSSYNNLLFERRERAKELGEREPRERKLKEREQRERERDEGFNDISSRTKQQSAKRIDILFPDQHSRKEDGLSDVGVQLLAAHEVPLRHDGGGEEVGVVLPPETSRLQAAALLQANEHSNIKHHPYSTLPFSIYAFFMSLPFAATQLT